jgi:hypothetical protein
MENQFPQVEMPFNVTPGRDKIGKRRTKMATLQELEKRIGVLKDIEEIKQLHCRYLNGLIRSNINEILPCFAKNGVIDIHAGTGKTPEGRVVVFKKLLSEHHIGKEGLFMVHPIINVNGNTAKGSWLLYLQFARPRKLVPRPTIFTTDEAPDWMQGFYEADYTKEDGEWKLACLKFRCRLVSPMSTFKGFKP